MQDVNIEKLNNNIFSDTEPNFQTLNMIYKIKKIKKKKTPKDTNYKNIELLETLTNNVADNTTNNPINESKKVEFVKGFVEGFKADDYEGYDTVNDAGSDNADDPRSRIKKAINDIYDSIVYYNRMTANKIISVLSKTVVEYKPGTNISTNFTTSEAAYSNESDFKSDADHLYKYICLAEAILFSGCVVNNWYFLMYYNKYEKGYKLFDFSRKKITESDSFVSQGLMYFFEYSLFFPEKIESILINLIPGVTTKILNHTMCYIYIFFILIYLSYNFASGFKNFLIDIIDVNSNNLIVAFMYLAVIILFFIPTNNLEDKISKLYNPLGNLLWNVIRFIVIMMISVPLGGFLCCVYFIFYSLFGMVFYSRSSIVNDFKDMLSYAEDAKSDISETPCQPLEWYKKIFQLLNKFSDVIYNIIFFITAIILLIYASVDSQTNMISSTIKNTLLIINVTLISMFFVFSLSYVKGIFEKDETGNISIAEDKIKSGGSIFSYLFLLFTGASTLTIFLLMIWLLILLFGGLPK